MSAPTTDLDRIDLSDLDAFADGPPWHLFAQLREHAPVHYNPLPDEDGFWSLTRYEDIGVANRDYETYSSGARGVFMRDEQVLPWEILKQSMVNMDPPLHTKHRGLVQKVFTPRAITEREPWIRDLTRSMLDRVVERGECDLVDDIAASLPMRVIADMLGVPESDIPKLAEWNARSTGFDDPRLRKDPEDGLQAFAEMGMYLLGLVAERREHPADDLATKLMNAEVDGERLTDIEMTAMWGFLMVAGNEEVRNTFAGGMLALMEHPDERRKLIEDPSLIPGAVEEILRWASAIIHMRRTATRDVDLHGTRIEAGQKVVMWYASGNRDAAAFDDPDRFDVTRTDTRHQAFGGGGRHFCLGNQLARLELRIMLEEVLARMPDMAQAGPVLRQRSNFFNGLLAVPVSFTPSSRTAA